MRATMAAGRVPADIWQELSVRDREQRYALLLICHDRTVKYTF